MFHSKSLRAIGQSLESFGVEAFELAKDGPNYVVRGERLPPPSELAARRNVVEKVWESGGTDRVRTPIAGGKGWLRYDQLYIAWLDAQGRKKRRRRYASQIRRGKGLSQLLRTVGKRLDRIDVHAFKISWAPDSVSLDYQISGQESAREIFTIQRLRGLGLQMRFRRASRR